LLTERITTVMASKWPSLT